VASFLRTWCIVVAADDGVILCFAGNGHSSSILPHIQQDLHATEVLSYIFNYIFSRL